MEGTINVTHLKIEYTNNMETFFNFADQIEAPDVEVGVDPLASNYADMISAIVIWTPDPRFYEWNDDSES